MEWGARVSQWNSFHNRCGRQRGLESLNLWVGGLCLHNGGKAHSGWLTREQSINLNKGEGVDNCVVQSMDVTDGGGELRYVVYLASLTRGVTIRVGVKCKSEGLVIGKYMKTSAFQEVAEVFDCEMQSQQLPVKGTVACLSRCHFPGEQRYGMPGTIDMLL